ncbi:MAG: thioredoxin family protein [Flavobacterium sp.]|nr:thioredoxin family protein [Flavobacterium sp.]
MNPVIAKALFKGKSYLEYRKLIHDLLSENKSTATEQTESLTHYSFLNDKRMSRLDKTFSLTNENAYKLKILQKEYIWLVISEGWCGDAAQILPVFHKMELASNKKIDLKIVLRDENEELIDLFLVQKSKSIPIIIILDRETGLILDHWGPRPKGAKKMIEVYKKNFGVIDEVAKTELQVWYFKDKGISIQNEIIEMISILE